VLRALERLAELGNRLPDPVTLFALLAALVALASAYLAGAAVEIAQRDGALVQYSVRSLLSAQGVRWFFESAVTNFTGFAPLGKVLTVMLGIGVAERSGLVALALRALVQGVPRSGVTAALVFAGVMSSLAADAGYVVLTPLGAVLFAGLGRHPLAGLAAAFAGVSGGYSANLLLTGLDPLLAGLTQEAARMVDPGYVVHAAANYYLMCASVVLLTAVGTAVSARVVEPLLGTWDPARADQPPPPQQPPARAERRALVAAGLAGAAVLAGMAWLALASGSPLRAQVPPDAPPLAALAPWFGSIELQIALLFFVPGVVYGALAGQIRSDRDVARMTADTMSTMGSYLVLAFVAAQFVAFFNWTGIGAVAAVHGARALEAAGLGGSALLLAFLAATVLLDLLVGSASAKWAFMAPVFVPMLMLSGLSPEATQAAYRIGDSVANIVSPLLPYLPVIIVFARRYDRDAGIGTLIAAMLPYSVAFALAWSALLVAWLALDLPLGPGVSARYP
jgi:aminobenzoyl-glutamate transport protein